MRDGGCYRDAFAFLRHPRSEAVGDAFATQVHLDVEPAAEDADPATVEEIPAGDGRDTDIACSSGVA